MKNAQSNTILMIAPTPFFADRGCHIRILEEALILEEHNHHVDIATYHLGNNFEGVTTVRIPPLFFWYKKLEAGPSWWKPLMDILMIIQVAWLLRTNKYAVIHAHLHEGVFIALIARFIAWKKIPILFDYQGSLTGELQAHHFIRKMSFLLPIFKFLENSLNKAADHIITSSSAAREHLIGYFKLSPNRVSVFLDQVSTTRFKPTPKNTALMQKYHIASDTKVIGYIGLLTQYQGIDLFFEAIALLQTQLKDTNNVTFLIMGYPNEEKYIQIAQELGIRDHLIFTGRVAYQELNDYLSLVDIAIAPKLITSESNGKILNYMACGLPTIAFDNNTNRELLKGTGHFASEISTQALADSMQLLLENQELRAELSKKSREAAEQYYSWEHFFVTIEKIYKNLNSSYE